MMLIMISVINSFIIMIIFDLVNLNIIEVILLHSMIFIFIIIYGLIIYSYY